MAQDYGMQKDEQGRPFFWVGGQVGGKKNYVSPAAFGEKPPADNSGFFHSKPQWNQNTGQWETPFDWGKLVTMGTGGLLGLGALDAFMPGLLGGAGGAGGAAGELPSHAIPGWAESAMGGPAAIGSQGASAAVPLGGIAADVLPSGSIPGGYGAPASIASQGASNAVQAGTDAANAGSGLLKNLTSAGGLAKLAGIIPALMSFAHGSGGGNGGGNGLSDDFIKQAYADAQREHAMQEARYRRVDPLHEAVTQLAYSRMPTNMQNGPLPKVPLPG